MKATGQTEVFTPAHLAFLKKKRREKATVNLLRLALLIALLAVWEVASTLGVIDSFIFSPPSKILVTLWELIRSGEILLHAGITLGETVAGFIIATVLGTALAVLLWLSPRLRLVLDPYVVVLNSLPKIALGPIIIIWFGSGCAAIIVMAVLIAVIVTAITMLGGFLETDGGKILLMRSLGASRWQMLFRLVIPSALPTFINMLKINVGLSWIGSIMGEYLVSKAGIGYLIVYGGQVFKMDLVLASTLVLCALATGMYALVALVERLALKRR
jgi:NitT/TauT family transport system permease protein